MNQMRRVFNNAAIALIAQLCTWFATLLLTAAYGRFLGGVATARPEQPVGGDR